MSVPFHRSMHRAAAAVRRAAQKCPHAGGHSLDLDGFTHCLACSLYVAKATIGTWKKARGSELPAEYHRLERRANRHKWAAEQCEARIEPLRRAMEECCRSLVPIINGRGDVQQWPAQATMMHCGLRAALNVDDAARRAYDRRRRLLEKPPRRKP